MIEAYPLTWPSGWLRTAPHQRGNSRYKVSMAEARTDLLYELGLMSAQDVIISSNLQLRRDGLPSAGQSTRIADPGVAVYFRRRGNQQVVACDKWLDAGDNLRAIGLTIAAMRGIERAGASELLDRAFTGFKALPASGESARQPWWIVLGVTSTTPIVEVRKAYRTLARQYHPDAGGDEAKMAEINRAYAEAQAQSDILGVP